MEFTTGGKIATLSKTIQHPETDGFLARNSIDKHVSHKFTHKRRVLGTSGTGKCMKLVRIQLKTVGLRCRFLKD